MIPVYDENKTLIVPGSGFQPNRPILKSTGAGTLSDPQIIWICDIVTKRERDAEAMRAACEKVARQEAIEKGFKCIVIRKEVHSTRNYRDPHTNRTVTLQTRGRMLKLQVPHDPHMTVFLGSSFQNCQLHGHIYTTVDKNNIPIAKVRPEDRSRPSEYWIDQSTHWVDVPSNRTWAPKVTHISARSTNWRCRT